MKKILLVFFCLLFCFPSVALAEEDTVDVYVFENTFHGEELQLNLVDTDDSTFWDYSYLANDSLAIDLSEALSFYAVVNSSLNGSFTYDISLQTHIESGYEFNVFPLTNEFTITYVIPPVEGFNIYMYFLNMVPVGNDSVSVSLYARVPSGSVPGGGDDDSTSNSVFDGFLGWSSQIIVWILSTFVSLVSFMVSNSICLIGLIITLVGILFVYLRKTIGG